MAVEIDTTTQAPAPAASPDDASGRAPAAGESFLEQWDRLSDASPDEPATAASSDEGSADAAKPDPGKPGRRPDGKFARKDKPAPKAPVGKALPADKRAQLEALAGELGLAVDLTEVHWRERAEVREQRRKMRAQQEQAEAALAKKYEDSVGGVKDRLAREEAVAAAWEARDHEALAKALGAKNWDEVQAEIIAKASDPNWKKLREHEQELARLKQERESATEQATRTARQQQEQQVRSEHFARMGEHMRQSADPVCKALWDDPLLRQSILQVQQENWDGVAVLPPEKAIRVPLKGAKTSIYEDLRAFASQIAKAFPDEVASALPKPDPSRKPAPRSAPVPPRRGAPEASVPDYRDKKTGRHDDRAFFDSFRERISEAASQERAATASGSRR